MVVGSHGSRRVGERWGGGVRVRRGGPQLKIRHAANEVKEVRRREKGMEGGKPGRDSK